MKCGRGGFRVARVRGRIWRVERVRKNVFHVERSEVEGVENGISVKMQSEWMRRERMMWRRVDRRL